MYLSYTKMTSTNILLQRREKVAQFKLLSYLTVLNSSFVQGKSPYDKNPVYLSCFLTPYYLSIFYNENTFVPRSALQITYSSNQHVVPHLFGNVINMEISWTCINLLKPGAE